MKKKFIILGITLLAGFALFSREIKQGAMRSIDFAAAVKIQEKIDTSSRLRAARLVGEMMEGSTFFASPEVSVVAVLTLAAFVGWDRKRKRFRWQAICLPIAFALLVGAEVYGKSAVHHPAPPFFMIKNPTTIFPKYYINDEFSYPSGHAARAMFMAVVSYFFVGAHVLRKTGTLGRLGVLGGLVGYVMLVSVSRIYLGHHWLSDIIGGWLLGAGTALTAMGIDDDWIASYNRRVMST